MEQRTRQFLLYICILIIVIIIIRCIYMYMYKKCSYEGFTSDSPASDLLTKLKSSNVQQYGIKKSKTPEMTIYPWSTQLYNIQFPSKQIKTISLYKPNLFINDVQYCKLGDIPCQNTDYSLPSSTDFTVLVKQSGSDIKSPTGYDVVVNLMNSNFQDYYYNYSQYLTNSGGFAGITNNLQNCIDAFTTLNNIVQSNLTGIQKQFMDYFNYQIINTPICYIYDGNNNQIGSVKLGTRSDFASEWQISIAAGMDIYMQSRNSLGRGSVYRDTIVESHDNTFNLPETMDAWQLQNSNDNLNAIINLIPSRYFENNRQASPYLSTRQVSYNIFKFIPLSNTLGYLKSICLDIQNICNNQSKNPNLVTSFNLSNNVTDATEVLQIINKYINNVDIDLNKIYDINGINLYDQFIADIIKYRNNSGANATLLGSIIEIIITMNMTYYMTYVTFYPNPLVRGKTEYISLSSYSNKNVISYIPQKMYNINNTPTTLNNIQNIIPNLTNFLTFITNVNNASIGYNPLQILSPKAPDGYIALGHVFSNSPSDLEKIKSTNSIACIPIHCAKPMRDWTTNDKIYEYNVNGVYFAIYYNPYTGTFIATNTNAQTLPKDKVYKIVACVKKCTAVDELEKADECTRNYYNLNKELNADTHLTPNLVSDQEEIFYLSKLKNQSDSIARLKTKAQKLQIENDKSTIINREMNKNKLQSYVDTQKKNIEIVSNRLEADKNKIQTNVKMPIDPILQMLNDSTNLTPLQIKTISDKIKSSDSSKDSTISDSCPQYDINGMVKKQLVKDVCYGCDSIP